VSDDCESSFKKQENNNIDVGAADGDLAHQYFDFLNRENEKL